MEIKAEFQSSDTARSIRLTVNRKVYALNVQPYWTLSYVLREKLGLTGTKEACGRGACGSCAVVVDGEAVPSCLMLAVEQEEKRIETVEALSADGRLHKLQEAWLEEYAAQCGFCSSGMLMSAKALLDRTSKPSQLEIKEALAGNICICSNYEHIVSAVQSAARKLKG